MARTADEIIEQAERLAEREPHHTSWWQAREEYLAARCATAENRLAEVEAKLEREYESASEVIYDRVLIDGQPIMRCTPSLPQWIAETMEKHEAWMAEAEAKLRRLAEVERERDALRQQAEQHAMEARTQRATVHEIYRVVTGGTGEPGDWHGAAPVREAFDALRADNSTMHGVNEMLRAELATLRDSDDHHRLACEHYASELATMRGRLEKSEAKLQRVRDWLKYEANSECGIANEIDGVLRAARGEAAG